MLAFPLIFWIGFVIFIILALWIDLFILHKKQKIITFKKALKEMGVWIALAGVLCIFIFYYRGKVAGYEFLTGYILELSLSMDNVFIFVLIFRYFKVPLEYQYRVLFLGVIGAILMRFVMIIGGIYLVQQFTWIFYIFGIFLIYSAYKISTTTESDSDIENNKMILLLRKYVTITNQYHGNHFIVYKDGKRLFTPLFIVLLLIEKTDLMFAIDSIPAILAITQDSFIVFASNIFAILGLRALYFAIAKIMDKFIYLKYGLSIILFYIGTKMILSVQGFHFSIIWSLGVIIITISFSIILSLFSYQKKLPE